MEFWRHVVCLLVLLVLSCVLSMAMSSERRMSGGDKVDVNQPYAERRKQGLVGAESKQNRDVLDIVGHEKRNQHILNALKKAAGGLRLDAKLVDTEQEQTSWKMTNAKGIEYECRIFSGGDEQTSGKQHAEERVTVDVDSDNNAISEEGRPLNKLEKVEELLKVLDGVCLQEAKGWWVYEICWKKHVRQFHMEGGKVTMDWSLGTFDPSSPRLGSLEEAEHGDEQVEEEEEETYVFLSHDFKGGQHCDETNSPRETQVQLYCCSNEDDELEDGSLLGNPSKQLPITLESIQEPSLCRYTVTLCSPLLCSNDLGFKPRGSLNAWTALRTLKGKCFQRTIGWWTFELCFESGIRQFHLEKAKTRQKNSKGTVFEEVGDQFSLGSFYTKQLTEKQLKGDDYTKRFTADLTAKTPLYFEKGQNPGFLQYYSGGSPCPLTSKKRETWVRYVCVQPNHGDSIAEVKELSTCKYEITFHTPHLCRHELFRPQHGPEHKLECNPVNAETPEESNR